MKIRASRLRKSVLFAATFILAACAEVPPPEPKTCGDLLTDEAVQREFAQFWGGRLAEVAEADSGEPPLGTEELDGMIDMFVLVTQGYCQADASQPIPYPDSDDDKFVPTSARKALGEYVERLQRSDD